MHIARTGAEVTGTSRPDVFVRGPRLLLENLNRREDHPRRAAPTLPAAVLGTGFLHGVRLTGNTEHKGCVSGSHLL